MENALKMSQNATKSWRDKKESIMKRLSLAVKGQTASLTLHQAFIISCEISHLKNEEKKQMSSSLRTIKSGAVTYNV